MDKLMNYEEAKTIVKNLGFEGFVKKLEEEFKYDFFNCSTSWYDNSRFICKLKGSKGDLIIGWNGIHN